MERLRRDPEHLATIIRLSRRPSSAASPIRSPLSTILVEPYVHVLLSSAPAAAPMSDTSTPSSATGDAEAASAPIERIYETVLLSEMEHVEDEQMYYYECPCGDMFEISEEDLANGITIARCPSCSLKVKVDIPLPEGKAAST